MNMSLWQRLKNRFNAFLERRLPKVAEINRKYAVPRIQMTPLTSGALFFLRLYLIFLVAVLFYKFYTLVK